MTSVSQLRKEFCQECAEQTVHDASGCVRTDCKARRRGAVAAKLDKPSGIALLAPREKQVFCLLAKEQTAAEIAKDLGLSPNTVRCVRESICQKLGIQLRRWSRATQPFSEFARANNIYVRGAIA